jgi:hypothetical protein
MIKFEWDIAKATSNKRSTALFVIANVIKAALFESSRQEKPRKTRVAIIKGLNHEN